MSFDIVDAYAAISKLEENQQIALAAVAFLIDKKVIPNVEELEKWAIEKQKKGEKDGKKTS